MNIIVLGLMLIQIARLSWVAAFGQTENTERYIHTLLKQLKNNAKIAQINKHSAWLAMLFAFAGVAINEYFYPKATPIDWAELSLLIEAIIVFIIVCMVWAHKRQIRFEKEATELEQLID